MRGQGGWRGLVSVATLAVAAATLSAQQTVFRGTVELIVADVQVVDRDGRAMVNLRPDNFQVTVGGKTQRVRSADYISFSHDVPTAAPPVTPRAPVPASIPAPGPPDEDRMFIVAVDVLSFPPSVSASVMKAAKDFVQLLGPNDLVGVFPYPSTWHVNPTDDRAAVIQGLTKIVGKHPSITSSRYHIRPGELIEAGIDMLNSVGTIGQPLPPTSEALLVRECGSRDLEDANCMAGLRSEVLSTVGLNQAIAEQSVGALRELMMGLATVPGRKTVVVVSAGMLTTDRPDGRPNVNDLSSLAGEEAARANATVYTVFVDANFMARNNAETTKGEANEFVSFARDSNILSDWHDRFSSSAGGTMITDLIGSGEIGFQLILRETSGYYRLGIDAGTVERNGKAQQIKVKVDTPNATVRGRTWVIVPAQKP